GRVARAVAPRAQARPARTVAARTAVAVVAREALREAARPADSHRTLPCAPGVLVTLAPNF
ncbi:MAG: hypothetical protein JW990_14605, partial [Thermoleophilia bacterium]|nr:hypothetical protein [Thermoleophilia bacterium]